MEQSRQSWLPCQRSALPAGLKLAHSQAHEFTCTSTHCQTCWGAAALSDQYFKFLSFYLHTCWTVKQYALSAHAFAGQSFLYAPVKVHPSLIWCQRAEKVFHVCRTRGRFPLASRCLCWRLQIWCRRPSPAATSPVICLLSGVLHVTNRPEQTSMVCLCCELISQAV